MNSQFLILREPSDVLKLLPDIRAQADQEREALGFLPEQAYREFALQRKLLALVESRGSRQQYAGHLLFGGLFPHLKVFQTSVANSFRQQGCGSVLIRALIAQAEQQGYLSIVANVADDLAIANAFYEKHGFIPTKIKEGGAARKRRIIVRVRELDTPNLISIMKAPEQVPISIKLSSSNIGSVPIYAIDLNVLFDAVRSRARSQDAGSLIEAALAHQIRLVITNEFIVELERNSNNRHDDPILAFSRRIPRLQKNTETSNADSAAIRKIIFRDKIQLSPQDLSDISHIAEAATAGAAGYITSDQAILNARNELLEQIGIDIIGLSEFIDLIDSPADAPVQTPRFNRDFQSGRADSDGEILLFLANHSPSLAKEIDLKRFTIKSTIRDASGVIAASAVRLVPPLEAASQLLVCVRQDHPYSSTIADHLISIACAHCSKDAPAKLRVFDIASHPITRRIALSHGFRRTAMEDNHLEKLAIGRPITPSYWPKLARQLNRLANVQLPPDAPLFGGADTTKVIIGKDEIDVELLELETLLSPTIFALSGRKAVILPITQKYAAELLDVEDQLSFLDKPEAGFLSQRTYYNSPKAVGSMKRGAIAAFYESKRSNGRGAVVAIARIVDVTISPNDQIPEVIQRGAVVEDPSALSTSDKITVTTFDNLMPLRTPVSLEILRRIGCVGALNLQTATPIAAEQLAEIIEIGWNDD